MNTLCVVTMVEAWRVNIMSHFLPFYASRSDHIHVIINNYDGQFYDTEPMEHLCRRYGASFYINDKKYSSGLKKKLVRALISNGEYSWYSPRDSDEFVDPDFNIRDAIEYCERHGFVYIKGRFYDMMNESGFPEIDPNDSLFNQFPVPTRITKKLLRGVDTKVVASHNAIKVSTHGVTEDRHKKLKYPVDVPVYHFKWDSTVVNRLQWRAQFYAKMGNNNWKQSDRFLKSAHELDLSEYSVPMPVKEYVY